jgi:hypothetical protein
VFNTYECISQTQKDVYVFYYLGQQVLGGADCDRDRYLVIAKVTERLAVAKQAAQRFDRQRFNLRKLNEPEFTNSFAALENLNDDKDVNRAWGNIIEHIKTSAKESLGLHELKQNKPWLDEECLDFLDERKQAKMQWIQAKAM